MAGTKTGAAGEQDFHCWSSRVASILAPGSLRFGRVQTFVIPAKAGIRLVFGWTPAFAGVTIRVCLLTCALRSNTPKNTPTAGDFIAAPLQSGDV